MNVKSERPAIKCLRTTMCITKVSMVFRTSTPVQEEAEEWNVLECYYIAEVIIIRLGQYQIYYVLQRL